ncbi:MAG TPA: 30S ribosomal protein S4 [Bdellovibrionota bacterium]|nr:30S ribosomal protein S4 [Bdellovibrionota bacterium]
MARYREPVCRLCRREGLKLFFKGSRCLSDKCSLERRAYAPGDAGQKRVKLSQYGIQLREKQKVRRLYGLTEAPFRNVFKKAEKSKESSGEFLLQLLERRLDSVCFKLGFGASRADARQLIRHRHVMVNGKTVTMPNYSLNAGDVIELPEKSRALDRVKVGQETLKLREIPSWLELNSELLKGTVKTLPTRGDITLPIEEHLIIELYSR